MNVSRPLRAACAAVALILSGSTLSVGLTHAQAQQLAPGPDSDVIIIMRDQLPGLPPMRGALDARASALASAQTPILSELQQSHASRVRTFGLINAIAATVSKTEVMRLATHPLVRAVIPDTAIRVRPRGVPDLSAGTGSGTNNAAQATDGRLCNTLEPQALELTHTAFASMAVPQAQHVRDGNGQYVTGQGVKVAFIADGLDTSIAGFTRSDGSPVFFDYEDFSGDPVGTPTSAAEAFGDASSIAAQDMPNGTPLLFDISQFVNPAHPLASPCNIHIRGVAPGASLAGLKAFSSLGLATLSARVQAIEWAVINDKVDVLNESFGSQAFPDDDEDPISIANDAAVQAGVTVVVSAGDGGSADTLIQSSSNPNVISAGATTQYRFYAQTGSGIIPLGKGGYVDDNISPGSSAGFSQSGARTLDVVAPGDLGWALCSTNIALYVDCVSYAHTPTPVESFGGTSEAAPLTSAEAALVIQAYRSTHHGINPTPARVKQIIMSTATDVGAPAFEQGAGLINSLAAVYAALAVEDSNGHPSGYGQGLLTSPTFATATDLPRTPEIRSFTVTNTGTTIQHLAPSLQTLAAPFVGATLTVTMNPATDPIFINSKGVVLPYIKQNFTVPAGAQHLDAAIAFQTPSSSSATPIVALGLLDPEGRQVSYSIPQGPGSGYGHVDVIAPAAGTWTAVMFTSRVGVATSYTGPVHFTWSAEHYTTFGSVFPAHLDLAPGASSIINASFSMPADAGDLAAAIRFGEGPDRDSAGHAEIPVTLRTLVPLASTGGTFTGTLTGGNGRPDVAPAQTFAFDVPSNAQNISLNLEIADTGYLLEGLLVDPHGMELSVEPNLDPTGAMSGPALQLFRYDPQPGRWRFILLQDFTSSGNQTSLPFTARIDFFSSEQAAAAQLPDSPDIKLSASGPPTTFPVQITNNGVVTQWYFTDARLRTPALVQIPTQPICSTPTLQGACELVDVPPEVTYVEFVGKSSVPLDMEAFDDSGYGAGITVSPHLWARPTGLDSLKASLFVSEVPYGPWILIPSLIGPYGQSGVPTGEALTTATAALMQPFDPAVSATHGNIWADVTLGTRTFHPLMLNPGQSGTVDVTFTPDPAHVGQTVSGFLYIETFNVAVATGDEVVRIPYSYTVVP